MNRLILFIPAILMLLSSCFKEDERIEPMDRGEKSTVTIEMTQQYKNQVYFSLEEGRAIATVDKQNHDLVFDSRPGRAGIFMNTANFMTAAATGKNNFQEVTSAAGYTFKFDASSGHPDSLAIDRWFYLSGSDTLYPRQVYLINRGFDVLGNQLGFRKVIFDSIKGDTYFFRYARLNESTGTAAQISKRQGRNFVAFSLGENPAPVEAQPDSRLFDLIFTQYTTLLYTTSGQPYPYLVTGVLLNPENTWCAVDSTLQFDAITREHALAMNYNNRPDIIGYDWKRVVGDVSSGIVMYEVRSERNFFIKTKTGYYFKMRFIGFYNNSGEKGYPTIEFQRL